MTEAIGSIVAAGGDMDKSRENAGYNLVLMSLSVVSMLISVFQKKICSISMALRLS